MIRRILTCLLVIASLDICFASEVTQNHEVVRPNSPEGARWTASGKVNLKKIGRVAGNVNEVLKVAKWSCEHSSEISEVVDRIIGPVCAIILVGIVVGIPWVIFCALFGGSCEERRSATGYLMSVKMPKSIVMSIILLYLIVLLPPWISWFAMFECEVSVAWAALGWSIVFVILPIRLQMGRCDARRETVGLYLIISAASVAVCVKCDGLSWWGWIIAVAGIIVPILLIGLLFLPQSNQWFRDKEALRERK